MQDIQPSARHAHIPHLLLICLLILGGDRCLLATARIAPELINPLRFPFFIPVVKHEERLCESPASSARAGFLDAA